MLIEAVCDGASRGQGKKKMGEAACGVVVYKNGKEIARYARGLGKRTNNEAEYEAVITSLLICSMAELNDPIIYSDSAVVVNQVNGKWQCRNDNLFTLLKSIKIIQKEFRFRIQHVPRAYVHEADRLANSFLNDLEKDKLNIIKK
jgi:ribonuclease HI